MHMPPAHLPGGSAVRTRPAGVLAGAALTRIDGPSGALGLVAAEVAAAEQRLHALIQSDVRAVPAVAGFLVEAGGKRLRPALTALGALAVGYEGDLASLMCVGELIHLGSLLHDDVVDQADTRRGRAASHKVYGNAVTILTGDFCLARAVLLASEVGGHRAVTALARAVTDMAEGEVLQLQRSGDLSATFEEYLELIDKKSAALISWCSMAGACAADDVQCRDSLAAYGRGVGVAFQITDDVLDYRAGTGKGAGADLRERKLTLPLLYAFEQDAGLRDVLLRGAPTEQELPGLIARVEKTGGLERALDYARDVVERSIRSLDALPDGPYRDALAVLGRYLVERAS
ncbi:MAG: octaprenyl-diphosphate synthase [Kiritimatiellia bacterium]|jgi:octaprenyl-diphosphate synthase